MRALSTRRMLQDHRPADAAEADHRRRMLELAGVAGVPVRNPRSPDPTSRDHFVPGHFTASAFILAPAGDALLLIHHRKLGRWLQPGGHIEPNDGDLLAAARRECAEEVGLPDLPLHARQPGAFDLDVHEIPPYGDAPVHEHFDVRFLLRAQSLQFDVGPEVAGARWVRIEEIEADPASDPSVLRAARKLRGLGG